MYWMAWSWTSIGIVMRTVGLDVGTGRGGMWRPASGTEAEDVAAEAAPLADGVIVQPASMSARGPDWSQARAPAAKGTSRRPRIMEADCGPRRGSLGRATEPATKRRRPRATMQIGTGGRRAPSRRAAPP